MCSPSGSGSGRPSAWPAQDYVLLNPLRAGLVKTPETWPYLGAVVPGYPRLAPFDADYWPWFWKHYSAVREPGCEKRVLPPREME